MDLSKVHTEKAVILAEEMVEGNRLVVKENKHYRWFEYGGQSIQSLMATSHPQQIVMPVAQSLLLFYLFKKMPLSVLNLGLGAGTLERSLSTFSGVSVTSVESAKSIIDMAKKYFYLPDIIDVVCQDALQFVLQTKEQFDVVLCDLFIGEKNPAFLFSGDFYQRLVNITTEHAVISLNINAESNQQLFQILSTIKHFFPYVGLIEFIDYSNLVIIASKSDIPNQQTLKQTLSETSELANLNLEAAINKLTFIPHASTLK
jgi:spermidine synthase